MTDLLHRSGARPENRWNPTHFWECRRQGFDEDFVIGLILSEHSKAYYFTDVEEAGVVSDTLGDIPVLVWAEGDLYQAFIRQYEDQELTFIMGDSELVEQETSSTWDVQRGLALSGPLKGKSLQPVPSLSSYDWAWLDFYPDSGFYGR